MSERDNDIAHMLASLHQLQGMDFIRQLRLIATSSHFTPLKFDPQILVAPGKHADDFEPLLNAARKAVEHGYRVYVLPNPQGVRTADFIFERKGIYKMYDLKTISGRSSVGNRLVESVNQTNRVLLNMTSDYNPIALARSIKRYFEKNPHGIEVLIFKGNKVISTTHEDTLNATFFKNFITKYIR